MEIVIIPWKPVLVFSGEPNTPFHRGHARQITKEETLALIIACHKEGLIHTVESHGVCNCCGDCCFEYRSADICGTIGTWPLTNTIAAWNESKCINCGICVRRCPMEAFKKNGKAITFDSKRCVGCGVCIDKCPKISHYLRKKRREIEMKNISIDKIKSIKEIVITDGTISFEEFIAVSKFHIRVSLSEECIHNLQVSRTLIERFLKEEQPIYGVTTGFGDNVKYTISLEDAAVLQKNILRSHAVSVGEPLEEEEVRAIILMIILNLGKGNSGVKQDTLQLLCDILNHDLYPFAPGDGSVGYLSVEAHICLTLIGEGFFLLNKDRIPAMHILSQNNLLPIELGCKEGLSLISGTTSATALSLLSLFIIVLRH